jgi:cell division protein FtsL
MIQRRELSRPARIANPRRVRAATQRRIVRKSRARYTGVARVFVVLGCVLVLLMSYVVLTSSLTGLSYAVAKAGAQREALQEETMRLDDRIAAMRSDDRLSVLAARLGMREPQHFAVVRLRVAPVALSRPRFPVFSSLAGLFAPAAARHR